MSGHHRTLWQIFRWPLTLGGLCLIGLVDALLIDGVWDGLGAALIALSLVVVVVHRVRASRR